jgi:hypothetical protein
MVALRSTLCGAFKDQRSVCHDHKTLAIPAPRPARGAGQCTTRPHLAGGAARGPGLHRHQGRLRRRRLRRLHRGAGRADGHGKVRYSAVNSCIRLAHSIDGMALWTVEDIAAQDGTLHPAQEAMVQCHGSQCGFCTPGFVMSLFGMYQNHVCHGQPITRAAGARRTVGQPVPLHRLPPILDAAQQMQICCRMSQVDEKPNC